MTEQEIIGKLLEIRKNPLYEKSCSLFKNFQFFQFFSQGKALNGTQIKNVKINEQLKPVLFKFDENGLIHSSNFIPAIEYYHHWEYWEHGIIKKIVDLNLNQVEFWENGIPVNFETYKKEEAITI